jgi:hypothetical protein
MVFCSLAIEHLETALRLSLRASVFRKPEHRELLLSGLRLAIGETT